MPIYEFCCGDCHYKFELLRSLEHSSDAATCPRCGGEVKRLLSTFASFSKGEGGETKSLGNSSCATCSATSCATCR
ncbi:MAG: zinc ribbon domain-containing protein [Chloroflexi bacterium]|nr:zinc ribbon domain-containing protein [Chloroflexota bacterium]